MDRSCSLASRSSRKGTDIETALDYFSARYYASMQGRFTGVDPYDIKLERQESLNTEEAEALFNQYIRQPQNWNHYSYAANNPLRYVDPDGWKDYEVERVQLQGKSIKIEVSTKIAAEDRAQIFKNITGAISRINEAKNLTKEEKDQLGKFNGIQVSRDFKGSGMNKEAGIFQMTTHSAFYPGSSDQMAGSILHDVGHLGQSNPEVDSDEFIDNEKTASGWALGVAKKYLLTKR